MLFALCLHPCFYALCRSVLIERNERNKRYKRNKQFDKFQSPERLTSSAVFRHSIPDPQSVSHFQCEALNLINAINAINATNALRFILFDLGEMSALCGYPTLIRCVTDDRNTSPLGFFYNSFFGKNQTFTGLYCKYTAAIFFNYIQCL